eukprot:Gb_20957 [translate_table: standard]
MKISLMALLSVCLFWSLMIMQLSVAQDIQQQYLSPHNDARSVVGVGRLQWDDTVAGYAQNYANQRSGDCALMHSGGKYGENIFVGSGKDFTPADAVSFWVGEKQDYDYASNTCAQGRVCGHYTQVVWKNSVKVWELANRIKDLLKRIS